MLFNTQFLKSLVAVILCLFCWHARAESSDPKTSIQRLAVIAPGDTVRVFLEDDPAFEFEGNVSIDGTVNLPFLGEVEVAGLSTDALAADLAKKLNESLYHKAKPQVILLEKGPAFAYVYGAVKKPGAVELPKSGELPTVQAISLVEGLSAWADADSAYILRRSQDGTAQRVDFSLREAFDRQSAAGRVRLKSGDELHVNGIGGEDGSASLSSEPVEIVVVGQVNSPGVIQFNPGEAITLMRAVFKAGGMTRFAKGDQIKLIRYAGASRQVEQVDLDQILEDGFLDKDRELYPGDMLIVPQKRVNF